MRYYLFDTIQNSQNISHSENTSRYGIVGRDSRANRALKSFLPWNIYTSSIGIEWNIHGPCGFTIYMAIACALLRFGINEQGLLLPLLLHTLYASTCTSFGWIAKKAADRGSTISRCGYWMKSPSWINLYIHKLEAISQAALFFLTRKHIEFNLISDKYFDLISP